MNPIVEGVIFVSLGAIAGAVCTYIGAIKIAKKNRRLDANAKLYSAFLPELMRLEKGEDVDARIIINDQALQRHINECNNFRFFLSSPKRKAFDIVWRNYRDNSHEYADCGQIDRRDSCRQLALKHIHEILNFSGYK